MIPAPPPGAVRFNPPPQWLAPEGFDPRRGHLVDPAWPPAPEDWELWVPDAPPVGRGLLGSERLRLLGGLAVAALAVFLAFQFFTGGSGGSSTGVGSCWSGVEGGEMDPVPCDSSRATHQIESRVSNPDDCPLTSGGYFVDGNSYLCVKRVG